LPERPAPLAKPTLDTPADKADLSMLNKILERLRRRAPHRLRPPAGAQWWRTKMIQTEFNASRQQAENARSDNLAIGRMGMALEVLLVEDNPGDVRLVQETFQEAHDTIHLHVAVDGLDAMAFLKHEGVHARSPRPDIILLDLDMPRMNGHEVLTLIKRDEDLKTIPTAILTASDHDIDVETSYALQANCHLKKPVELLEFQELVKAINQFWLTTVKPPLQPGAPRAFQNFDEARQVPATGPDVAPAPASSLERG
jgi:chemotaxis family two-component system response regulator Rcp1